MQQGEVFGPKRSLRLRNLVIRKWEVRAFKYTKFSLFYLEIDRLLVTEGSSLGN